MCSLPKGLAHMAAGRYEEALSWADRALFENGGLPALRFKLAVLGHLGRIQETSECLRRLQEIHSKPTIANFQSDWPKVTSPEFAAHYIQGLRKAGLPEN